MTKTEAPGWAVQGAQALFALLGLWVCLFLAWSTLSFADFFYPMLHDSIGIAEVVDKYGPLNRHKRGFEDTLPAEHYRLFGEIVRAVNHNGEGLDALRYHGPDGRVIDTLLHQAEVVHLQDVANLLRVLRGASYGAATVLGGLLVLFLWKRWPLPSARTALAAVLGLAGLLVTVVLVYGPVDVFYGLHTLVFPAGHQWFFYYQDSLMTTLMKAPDLFGYIAVMLAGLGLIYYAVLLLWLRRLSRFEPLP